MVKLNNSWKYSNTDSLIDAIGSSSSSTVSHLPLLIITFAASFFAASCLLSPSSSFTFAVYIFFWILFSFNGFRDSRFLWLSGCSVDYDCDCPAVDSIHSRSFRYIHKRMGKTKKKTRKLFANRNRGMAIFVEAWHHLHHQPQ